MFLPKIISMIVFVLQNKICRFLPQKGLLVKHLSGKSTLGSSWHQAQLAWELLMGIPMFYCIFVTSECCLDVEFLLSFCVFFVAKIMLPNDALHNFVKKLKAVIHEQTLELFLTADFKFLTVALLVLWNNKYQTNVCRSQTETISSNL